MRNTLLISLRHRWSAGALALLLITLSGCQDLTGADDLPAGIPDPKILDNQAGAIAQYNSALCHFYRCEGGAGGTFWIATLIGGVLTDELQSSRLGTTLVATWGSSSSELPLDARRVSVAGGDYSLGMSGIYERLHGVRRVARLAAAALLKHGAGLSPALRGHMFAIEGYAEIFLADLFCSGVPLSTVDFERDFTYVAGSTTSAVYAHAITLLDSAIRLSPDSARVINLARIGKARALLARGQYEDAADIAALVPDGFAYRTMVRWLASTNNGQFANSQISVANGEGRTGLLYRASRDPRTTVVRFLPNPLFTSVDTLWFPTKYGTGTGDSEMTVADAVEARLIQAEAALQRNDIGPWLTALNRLRTDGTWIVRPSTSNPALPDTVWQAGTGGMPGLFPLQDPGLGLVEPARTDARIDLLFAERAAWLFLTGHRQGDLRRLVRLPRDGGYGRQEDRVYPTGPYRGAPYLLEYGSDVDLVIPDAEYRNGHFTGCQERGV